jgi:hypothetical protein
MKRTCGKRRGLKEFETGERIGRDGKYDRKGREKRKGVGYGNCMLSFETIPLPMMTPCTETKTTP